MSVKVLRHDTEIRGNTTPPPIPRRKALYKRSALALAILGIATALPAAAGAAEYLTGITGDETGYEDIRSESGSDLIYGFSDGDRLVLNGRENAVEASYDDSFTLQNSITVSNNNEGSAYVVYSRALYAHNDGVIRTDNLNIDSTSVNATANGFAVAVGLDVTNGRIYTKDIAAHVTATGADGTTVDHLQAQGFKVAVSGGIEVDGNADITLSTQNVDSTGSSHNSNIAGAVLQDGADENNSLKITGRFSVSGTTVLITHASADAPESAAAMSAAIAVYDGGKVDVGSLSADLSSIVTAENGVAESYGLLSAFSYQPNTTADITTGQSDIRVSAEARDGGQAQAVGIMNLNGSSYEIGGGDIEASAYSDSGSAHSANAAGIYTIGGTVTKAAGNITVKSNGTSYGIFANQNAEVNYAGGTIDVTGYDPSYAAGICVNYGSVVNLNGDTEVNAGYALIGNGTVVVAEDTASSFNGICDEFTGDGIIRGKAALGMSGAEAAPYSQSSDAASLTLWAGEVLTGRYVVGTEAQGSSAAGSALDLLSDGTLIIVADSNYDGQTPLVTVDEASAEPGSVLRLVNSARIQGGTTVLNVLDESTAPQAFVFETDNLLTEVVDNKIVKKSAENVFGSGLLMPRTVDEALGGAGGTGADRIIDLTSDALDVGAAAGALNRIALMSAAGGAQIAASNAAGMIDDSIMRHGSKLAALSHESLGPDLWIDLSGSFSRAHDFKAGSSSYGFKSDLAGGTVGADFSIASGAAVGAALSFGTGSVRGQDTASGTKNDVDYWGINLYGAWDVGLVNMIGSIGWLQTKNDISQGGYSAEPDVAAFTVSARFEKTFALGAGYAVVPHVGVRWAHIDMDDFTAGGFRYESEKVDLVSFPIGVAFSNAFAAGAAELKPFLDLEVAPTAGDKQTDNRIGLAGGTAEDILDTRIASSVVYSARIGLSGSIGTSHDFGFYYGVSAGNGEYVSQQLKASYRYVF